MKDAVARFIGQFLKGERGVQMNALLGRRMLNRGIRPQLGLRDEAVRGITQGKTVPDVSGSRLARWLGGAPSARMAGESHAGRKHPENE